MSFGRLGALGKGFGRLGSLGAGKVVVVPYVGPGDLTTFTAWYGLRGYSAAYSTGANAGVDLVDQAGANAVTIKILANGNLDLASITAWVTAHSVTTIKITKLYDQTGNGNHVVNVTLATMPTLQLTALGAFPAVSFAAASSTFLQSASNISSPLSQPFSASLVVNDSTTGNAGPHISSSLNTEASVLSYFQTNYSIFAGTTNGYISTFTQAAWHAIQAVIQQSSNVINLDGTAPTFNNNTTTGTNGFTNKVTIGKDGFGNFATALFAQFGLLSGAMSSPVQGTVRANDRTYWGLP